MFLLYFSTSLFSSRYHLAGRCYKRLSFGTMPSLVPHIRDDGVEEDIDWAKVPVYKGTTSYEALPDIKDIVITGGAGFIASWLVRHLVLTYPNAYRIICFDKLDYCGSLNNVQGVQGRKNFVFCYGDITSKSDVMRCLKKYHVDTIFHFAAQSHVDLSFGNSFQFTKNNVEGTHVMLECAVDYGIQRFIHISTDEVNGEVNFGDPDLLENSLLAPTNPYAASKAAAEMYVNAYAKSFKLPVIIIRSNNVYGPHQFPESKSYIPIRPCALTDSYQKSSQNSHAYSTAAHPSSCMALAPTRAAISMQPTQLTLSTRSYTKAKSARSTTSTLTTRSQTSNSQCVSLLNSTYLQLQHARGFSIRKIDPSMTSGMPLMALNCVIWDGSKRRDWKRDLRSRWIGIRCLGRVGGGTWRVC